MRKLKLDELNRLNLEDYKATVKLPVTIVLDNIRSAFNVGSIFRSSDAFLIERVVLCGITSTPPHKEILKTAIGANRSVEWLYVNVAGKALEQLKTENYCIIGIEQTTASISLSEFKVDANQKYAIVFGNEVEGLSKDILPLIDNFIEIPQFGTKHSLNVSVCAGIVLYEFSEVLRK